MLCARERHVSERHHEDHGQARAERAARTRPARRSSRTGARGRRRRSTRAASSRKPQGRFEIRAKLPKGAGFWPAFWMTSQNYPFGGNGASGELDVFEIFGQSTTDLLTSCTVVLRVGVRSVPNGTRWSCTTDQQAHTDPGRCRPGTTPYALEWDRPSIRWYFDGVKVFEIGDGMQYKWASAAPYAGTLRADLPEAVHGRRTR